MTDARFTVKENDTVKYTIKENIEVIKQVLGVDLASDTVTADSLLEGITAHDKNGVQIIGTMNDANKIIDRSLTEISNDKVTSIGYSAFQCCYILTSANFQNVTFVGAYGFINCYALTTAILPNVTELAYGAFMACTKLSNTDFSNLKIINRNVFQNCKVLTSVKLPKVESIDSKAFDKCNLESIIIGSSAIATLKNIDAFGSASSPTVQHIYVPADLVDSYKSATNWSSYADLIEAIPS